jgi:glutamate synthase domain-containing protein 3
MTGGRVVVLGRTGVNFGAGMSGGLAYVYDEERIFDARCNLDMVDLELVVSERDKAELKGLLEKHWHYTGSRKARRILDDWENHLPLFIKVFPMEYRRVLGQMMREDEATERAEVVHG